MTDEVLTAIISTFGSILVAYITTILSRKKISHEASRGDGDDCEHKVELDRVQALQTDLLIRLGKAWNRIEVLEAQLLKEKE